MLRKLLLEEVGGRLAKQPFEGIFWKQWAKYIEVSPSISEVHPLWELKSDVLENELSLFGVKPEQLKKQISDYKKRSRVIQWLLRLFTRINTKIRVWSYYQQCLSFREWEEKQSIPQHQKEINVQTCLTIRQALLSYLQQDIHQFKKMIDRQLGGLEEREDKFLLRYAAYTEQQEAGFFKLLEDVLKSVSSESERGLLRNILKEEYRGMREMMNKFKESCFKGVKQVQEQLSSLLPILTSPLVKKETEDRKDKPPSDRASVIAEARALPRHRVEAPINDIEALINQERKGMECLLAQGDSVEKERQIELFLKNSFHQLRIIVESRIGEHQALVRALKSRRLSYREASKQSKVLQAQLSPFFKKKIFLLFHPDKYHCVSESIKQTQHALVIQVQELYKRSIDELLSGIQSLQRFIPAWELDGEQGYHERLLQSYRELYRGFREELIEFYEGLKVRQDAWTVRQDAWKVRQDAMEVEIQELKDLFKVHVELKENQAGAPDNEITGSRVDFFSGP